MISSIIDGYKHDNIYNCDETGLFYRALPDNTLAVVQGTKTVEGMFDRSAVLQCNRDGFVHFVLFLRHVIVLCTGPVHHRYTTGTPPVHHRQYIDTCAQSSAKLLQHT